MSVIRVDGLGKRYRLGSAPRADSLRDLAPNLLRRMLGGFRDRAFRGSEEFWSLRDLSFQVKRGEVLGVVGKNGAGKSTLLKILSRVVAPTEGRAEIAGRVGSLLEVGTGFHPELTGRENIFLNGALLGMRRSEVQGKLDAIVEFSGISRFLETPVKRYSSGMNTRLGFAVAAHLDTEILIVDEVLAVGDVAFQRKCLGKMNEVAGSGRTVLFVSHNMSSVRSLCTRAISLDAGRLVDEGSAEQVVQRYLERHMERAQRGDDVVEDYRVRDNPIRRCTFTRLGFSQDFDRNVELQMREAIPVHFELDVTEALEGANVTVVIKNNTGEVVSSFTNADVGLPIDLRPGRHRLSCTVEGLHLLPGHYAIDIGIDGQLDTLAWDVLADVPGLTIQNTGAGRLPVRSERPGVVVPGRVAWRVDADD